jgi:hypothetical protein
MPDPEHNTLYLGDDITPYVFDGLMPGEETDDGLPYDSAQFDRAIIDKPVHAETLEEVLRTVRTGGRVDIFPTHARFHSTVRRRRFDMRHTTSASVAAGEARKDILTSAGLGEAAGVGMVQVLGKGGVLLYVAGFFAGGMAGSAAYLAKEMATPRQVLTIPRSPKMDQEVTRHDFVTSLLRHYRLNSMLERVKD